MKLSISKNLAITLDVILGSHCEVDEKCALLDYYAASSGNFLPIGCPETSVRNYHYSFAE